MHGGELQATELVNIALKKIALEGIVLPEHRCDASSCFSLFFYCNPPR